MQVNITRRYHFVSIRMRRIKKSDSKNIGKDMENQTLINCYWECKTQPLWKQSSSSLTRQHSVTTWPSSSPPRYIPKRTGCLCPRKNLYTNTCSSIIQKNQRVGTTPVYSRWWVDKQNGLAPHSGVLLSHKKEWSIDTCHNMKEHWYMPQHEGALIHAAAWRSADTCHNMKETWKHHAKVKKPATKDHILYDSLCEIPE